MPRRRQIRNGLTRGQRIERACELFSRGYSNTDVAKDLGVARNTAIAYRAIYEQRMRDRTAENPRFLQDVLGNTFRQIEELEELRRSLWQDMERAKTTLTVICEECEHENDVEINALTTRNAIAGTLVKVQDQRAKLYGVLGVKAEFFAMVAGVKAVQDALLKFMATELCQSDREKLSQYLDSPEIAQYLSTPVAAIDAQSWEDAQAS